MKIGLGLGGGGARGLVHIGIFHVLHTHKIPVSVIAGTSAGAIVGAMFAGKTSELLKRILWAEHQGKKILVIELF